MFKKTIIVLVVVLLLVTAYCLYFDVFKTNSILSNPVDSYKMPKVLFITTGDNVGKGDISQGVSLAIRSFNKRGVFVRLESRDVLLDPEVLSNYTIMILSTAVGYHDADRRYSLTYLSNIETDNIIEWVENGGVLIAGDNIGRNTLEGTDRTTITGELNPETWKFSECFGIKMREREMKGLALFEKDINVWGGKIKEHFYTDEWALVITEVISDKAKVLAEWNNGIESIPATIENDFGKGKAYLLATSYLLHPSDDGGISSAEQIDKFYEYILNNYKKRIHNVQLMPWVDGYSTAFAITFNSSGTAEQCERILSFLEEENLPATFFLDSSVSREKFDMLESYDKINLQSNSYSRPDFSILNYSESVREINLIRQKLNRQFTGFRFPYSRISFWGMLYIDEEDYIYDSSIGVDYLNSYRGSVFPYNIVISKDSYYKSLDVLEISPILNDDYFFYQKVLTDSEYSDDLQTKDAQLYEKYLMNFYDYVVKENNSLMVFIGHPSYTGISDITLSPLKNLIDSLRKDNCWIISLEKIAEFRNNLKDLSVGVEEFDSGIDIRISLTEGKTIKGLTFKLDKKPRDIVYAGEISLKEIDKYYYLTVDAVNEGVIKVFF
ncbi:MAG: beta-galactosidase trimerization domain-containing protein [Ignavibacteria bacterium]|nr:beta-galactosidase trimerization domain-containing protein [Ignavibacteria bacterium]